MELKFTFGASNPLPLQQEGAGSASAPGSGVLELRVSFSPAGDELVCEGRSGDGVSYASTSVRYEDRPLHLSLRSALARGGAELPEPLLGAVNGIVLDLGGREAEALEGLGLTVAPGASAGAQLATVDAALQARTGIAAGTPITAAA